MFRLMMLILIFMHTNIIIFSNVDKKHLVNRSYKIELIDWLKKNVKTETISLRKINSQYSIRLNDYNQKIRLENCSDHLKICEKYKIDYQNILINLLKKNADGNLKIEDFIFSGENYTLVILSVDFYYENGGRISTIYRFRGDYYLR